MKTIKYYDGGTSSTNTGDKKIIINSTKSEIIAMDSLNEFNWTGSLNQLSFSEITGCDRIKITMFGGAIEDHEANVVRIMNGMATYYTLKNGIFSYEGATSLSNVREVEVYTV